jgi:hypothetical protein
MLRKTLLALAAVSALGTAALAPTSASAWGGWGFHHHHWWGPRVGFYVGGPAYAYDGCLRRRWVPTPWGWRPRLVNVCY